MIPTKYKQLSGFAILVALVGIFILILLRDPMGVVVLQIACFTVVGCAIVYYAVTLIWSGDKNGEN